MITVFEDGQPADRTLLNTTLAGIHDRGASVLQELENAYTDSLGSLERRLAAINSRRQRALLTPAPGILGTVSVTDFTLIDQAQTTASVRIDNGAAGLAEIIAPRRVNLDATVFTSDSGTVNTFGTLYQVLMDQVDSEPIGTFNLTLASTIDTSAVLIDIVATPSQPQISVSVSADGTTYVQAASVSLQGYRIVARIQQMAVKYIRLTIQPTHADDTGGRTYSFGITDLALSGITFQLSSELTSRAILISPRGSSFRFVADADPGIQFYLAVNGGPFTQVASGDPVAVPGAATTTSPGVAMSGIVGVLNASLSANLYPNTLSVTGADGTAYPLLHGLDPGLPGVAALAAKSIAVYGTQLTLVPQSSDDGTKTFNLSYETGPQQISIQLRAIFNSENNTSTPVFRGVTFQEI